MDIINNYAYKVSALLSGGMFVKVCIQGHSPSWYVYEDQQQNAWKLFGYANLTIGISAFVCSTQWEESKKEIRYLLKFGVFAFTLATFVYMGPLRKVPANQEEKVLAPFFGVLAALMAIDISQYCFTKASLK